MKEEMMLKMLGAYMFMYFSKNVSISDLVTKAYEAGYLDDTHYEEKHEVDYALKKSHLFRHDLPTFLMNLSRTTCFRFLRYIASEYKGMDGIAAMEQITPILNEAPLR
jgi:hypothetical protein